MATAEFGRTRLARAWRSWLSWLFLLGAVLVSTVGGIVVSRAWAARDWHSIWTAGMLLITAVLMVIEGMQKEQWRRSLPTRTTATAPISEIPDDGLPRLGEILVYKYRLIAEKDLKKALAKQTQTGQRLGEVLVEMGKLDWHDLAMALEDQLSYGDPWQVA